MNNHPIICALVSFKLLITKKGSKEVIDEKDFGTKFVYINDHDFMYYIKDILDYIHSDYNSDYWYSLYMNILNSFFYGNMYVDSKGNKVRTIGSRIRSDKQKFMNIRYQLNDIQNIFRSSVLSFRSVSDKKKELLSIIDIVPKHT